MDDNDEVNSPSKYQITLGLKNRPSPETIIAYVCDANLLEETQKIPNIGYRVSLKCFAFAFEITRYIITFYF